MNLRTFVNYLYGFDGGVATSDGATRPEPLDRFGYRLTVADAWRDVDTGETVVEHRGTVRMTSPPHFIDIRILDPTVRIAADGRSGRIVASGQGSGPMNPGATEPSLEPFTDATLVDLDLTAGAVRTGDGGRVRTYVGVPGRIAGGDAERYLAYPSGTAYGTFTVTIPAAVPDRDPTPDGGGAGGGAGGGTGGGTPVAPGPGTPPGPPITAAPPKTPGGAAAKRVTARVVGPRGARRTVTLTTATRIGASGSRSYRVRLVRRGRTVATGTLKGRRLRVVVRSTGRTKGGRARYPRLTGAYVLRAQGGAAKHRIPATTLRVR
nr:HtaA domain-containing protein [Patulibacter sp. SYSU D01012]